MIYLVAGFANLGMAHGHEEEFAKKRFALSYLTGFHLGPVLLAVLLITHALVGYVELGTDSWIGKITGAIMASPQYGLLLFVYTSSMMFALRFFAGPIVERGYRGFDPELPAVEFAQLWDNHSNTYRRVGFGVARPKGQVRINSIYPGKSLEDLLVFEVPVDAAEYLLLQLPAKNLGQQGAFRFQIPRASIQL